VRLTAIPTATAVAPAIIPAFAMAFVMLLMPATGPAAAKDDAYASIVNAKVPYAADIVMSNGKVTVKGRVNHRPGSTRTELILGKSRTISILDLKSSKMLIYRSGQKRYRELPMAGQALAAYMPPGVARKDLRVQAAGDEMVGGEATRKLKVSYPSGAMTLWQTKDGIVVKMDGHATMRGRKSEVTMELKNIKRGPQDAALFVPPPGSLPMGAPIAR